LIVIVFAVTAVVHFLLAASASTTVCTAACIRARSAHERFYFLFFLEIIM